MTKISFGPSGNLQEQIDQLKLDVSSLGQRAEFLETRSAGFRTRYRVEFADETMLLIPNGQALNATSILEPESPPVGGTVTLSTSHADALGRELPPVLFNFVTPTDPPLSERNRSIELIYNEIHPYQRLDIQLRIDGEIDGGTLSERNFKHELRRGRNNTKVITDRFYKANENEFGGLQSPLLSWADGIDDSFSNQGFYDVLLNDSGKNIFIKSLQVEIHGTR